ncbi:copper-binding protein [Hoeflea alexandrii]
MKKLISTVLAAGLFTASLAGSAFAETFVKGTVEKVDKRGKKITIAHEELKDLDMPAMTMVFRTADDTLLETLEEGSQIEFVAERIDGKLTVTKVK